MNYFRKRVITSVIVFIIAVNLDFFLPHLVPGNAGEILASGHSLPASAVKLIEDRFGLNQPLSVQYVDYLKGIFATWPPFFGFSFSYYPDTVTSLVAYRAQWTLLLLISSFALSITLCLVLGLFTFMKRGSKRELSTLYTSIVFWAMPGFFIAIVILFIFGVTLKILPMFGTTGFNAGTGLAYIGNVLQHAILPVLAMTAIIFGQLYIVLRGAAQQVLGSDYITAAEERGLRENVISYRYVIRNALLPLVSLTGFYAAQLVSGAVVIESVFGYGGVGDLIFDGINSRDYPLVQGCFFYITVIVIVLGLFGDYFLTRLDPR